MYDVWCCYFKTMYISNYGNKLQNDSASLGVLGLKMITIFF